MTSNLLLAFGLLLLVVAVAGTALRVWRGRAQQQEGEDLPELPEPPAEPGNVLAAPLRGTYLGTVDAGHWLEWIAARGSGGRDGGYIAVYETGVRIDRAGEAFWIPREAVRGARLERAHAGKVATPGRLIVVAWSFEGRELETGFRGEDRARQPKIVRSVHDLIGPAPAAPMSGEVTSPHALPRARARLRPRAGGRAQPAAGDPARAGGRPRAADSAAGRPVPPAREQATHVMPAIRGTGPVARVTGAHPTAAQPAAATMPIPVVARQGRADQTGHHTGPYPGQTDRSWFGHPDLPAAAGGGPRPYLDESPPGLPRSGNQGGYREPAGPGAGYGPTHTGPTHTGQTYLGAARQGQQYPDQPYPDQPHPDQPHPRGTHPDRVGPESPRGHAEPVPAHPADPIRRDGPYQGHFQDQETPAHAVRGHTPDRQTGGHPAQGHPAYGHQTQGYQTSGYSGRHQDHPGADGPYPGADPQVTGHGYGNAQYGHEGSDATGGWRTGGAATAGHQPREADGDPYGPLPGEAAWRPEDRS